MLHRFTDDGNDILSVVTSSLPFIIGVESTPAVLAEYGLKFRVFNDDSCVTSCKRNPLTGFSP